MEVLLRRYKSDEKATLGKLNIDGEFYCYTLEDEYREKKVMHETRIPAGKYLLELRTIGTFHEKFKVRYPRIHKGMIEITNIPNFSAVLIHPGNTEKDTSGCILVGDRIDEQKMQIVGGTSTPAYLRVYLKIANHLALGHKATIEIQDLDR